jgi:hypothetical protein
MYPEDPAIGRRDTGFLGFPLYSSKCWEGSLVPRCYCMLLMQPSRLKFINILKSLRTPRNYVTLNQQANQNSALIVHSGSRKLPCNVNHQILSRASRLVSIAQALHNIHVRNWSTRLSARNVPPISTSLPPLYSPQTSSFKCLNQLGTLESKMFPPWWRLGKILHCSPGM